jgi:hypothetical protein
VNGRYLCNGHIGEAELESLGLTRDAVMSLSAPFPQTSARVPISGKSSGRAYDIHFNGRKM